MFVKIYQLLISLCITSRVECKINLAQYISTLNYRRSLFIQVLILKHTPVICFFHCLYLCLHTFKKPYARNKGQARIWQAPVWMQALLTFFLWVAHFCYGEASIPVFNRWCLSAVIIRYLYKPVCNLNWTAKERYLNSLGLTSKYRSNWCERVTADIVSQTRDKLWSVMSVIC